MRFTIVSISFLFAATVLSISDARADAARGKEIFSQRCVMCHGAEGAGDGAAAAGMPEGQKPRNLQEAKYKYATDDAKMKEVINKGGAGVGLSAMMPAQPDLSDADLTSLVEHIHSLKK